MNIDYKIKKEYFKMQVQNEKELIQIPIDIFYDEFTVYESNERVAFVMLKTVISQEDIEKNMPFFTENLWYWTEGTKELNFQLGNDFIKNKIGLTINELIKENEKINYERMQKVAEIILKNKNIHK
jgi:hypothetical protein